MKAAVPTGSGIDLDVTLTENLKQLWGFCFAAAPKAAPAAAGSNVVHVASVDDDAPSPEGVPKAIEKVWASKHGFRLLGPACLWAVIITVRITALI